MRSLRSWGAIFWLTKWFIIRRQLLPVLFVCWLRIACSKSMQAELPERHADAFLQQIPFNPKLPPSSGTDSDEFSLWPMTLQELQGCTQRACSEILTHAVIYDLLCGSSDAGSFFRAREWNVCEIELKASVPLPLKDVKQKPLPTWQKPLGLLARKVALGWAHVGKIRNGRELAVIGLWGGTNGFFSPLMKLWPNRHLGCSDQAHNPSLAVAEDQDKTLGSHFCGFPLAEVGLAVLGRQTPLLAKAEEILMSQPLCRWAGWRDREHAAKEGQQAINKGSLFSSHWSSFNSLLQLTWVSVLEPWAPYISKSQIQAT